MENGERDDAVGTLGAYALPLCFSLTFPVLLDKISDSNLSFDERYYNIIGLLLAKRLYIYILALSTVYLISKQSLNEPLGFGERLMKINEELFPFMADNNNNTTENSSAYIYKILDEKVKGLTEALFLPLLLGGSLILSFLLLKVSSSTSLNFGIDFGLLVGFSNLCVCIAFTRLQIAKLLTNERKGIASLIGSTIISSIAILSSPTSSYWALFNVINQAIAVVVGRVIQVPGLFFVLLALFGVTCYDVISVTGTSQFTDSGTSVMEVVARAKVNVATETVSTAASTAATTTSTTQLWQPGLFEVVIGGKVSDVLGIGDALFPSVLAGWAYRFDNFQKNKSSLFAASLIGYGFGCLLMETLQTGQGQPALLYITPSMSLLMLVTSLKEGTLSSILATGIKGNDRQNEG